MRALHPRRVLLVAAVALAGAGVASAVAAPGADVVHVAAGADHTSTTVAPELRPGSSRPTVTTTAAGPAAPSTSAAPIRSTTTTRPRSASAATPTSQPTTTGPTTSTTIDWRAAGLPGPVGSTIQPYTRSPYVTSNTGSRSGLTVRAAADGGRPGETMRLTIDASWVPFRDTGSITIVGPMDYTKPADQQRTKVLNTWSTPCEELSFLDPGEQRTVSVDIPLQPIVKPEFTMNNLVFEVFTTQTACAEGGGRDAYVQLSFNVAEPYVVVAPGPGLGLPYTG